LIEYRAVAVGVSLQDEADDAKTAVVSAMKAGSMVGSFAMIMGT